MNREIRDLGQELARDYGRFVLEGPNRQIMRAALLQAGLPVTAGSMDLLEMEIRSSLGLPYVDRED